MSTKNIFNATKEQLDVLFRQAAQELVISGIGMNDLVKLQSSVIDIAVSNVPPIETLDDEQQAWFSSLIMELSMYVGYIIGKETARTSCGQCENTVPCVCDEDEDEEPFSEY